MKEELEKKAEKYAVETYDYNEEGGTDYKARKEAYIAGATENGIVWHKVTDGDLPSEEGGWVCNQDGLPCYFDWGTEQWLDCEGTQIRTTEWCHMPHKE